MKKIFIYNILLCSALLTVSCNDWLDVKPQAQIETEDLFKKAKGFEDALISCYIKMNAASLYGKSMTMTSVEYLAQHWDHTSNNYKEEDKLKDFQYQTDYSQKTFSDIYGGLYNVIVQANTIIENISTMGDAIKSPNARKLIEGEALGIRAFCHTDILRLFGQLPENATQQVQLPYAKTVSNATIPYYSFNDYVKLILEDIQAAQLLLKESDPLMKYTFQELNTFSGSDSKVDIESKFFGYRRFRMNYYALEALKARLYMYTGNKPKAYEAALNVINAQTTDGEKQLTLGGSEDFSQKYYSLPSECILSLSNNEMTTNLKDLFETDGLFLTIASFNTLFANQSTSVNNRALYVWKETSNNIGSKVRVLQKYLQPENKDVSDESSLATKQHNIPLLRLSEMYLIAIESANTLTEANNLYIEYMNARSVIATALSQDELTAEILKEYRREFFAEGQMFYTYKRLRAETMLWKTDRKIAEKDYIVPLPTTELGSN